MLGMVENNELWVAKMKVDPDKSVFTGLRVINTLYMLKRKRSSCPVQFSVIIISFTYIYHTRLVF